MLPQLMRKVIFSSDINDKLNDTWDFNLAYLMLFFTLEASSGSLRYIIAPFFLPPNDYKAIIDWINSSCRLSVFCGSQQFQHHTNHLVLWELLPFSPSELILVWLPLYYLVLLNRNNWGSAVGRIITPWLLGAALVLYMIGSRRDLVEETPDNISQPAVWREET